MLKLITRLLLKIAVSSDFSSSMLTPAEFEALGVSTDEAKKLEWAGTPRLPKLDGIVFKNVNEWTIWLNGIIHSPNKDSNFFKILTVTPQSVTVECLQDANKVIELKMWN